MIQIKNAADLQKMRKACAISAAALKAGGEAIEPGITTAEIDKIIYDFIVRHGARPNFLHLYGFPATACISVNDTVIHGIPNKQQQIRPGDIVSIDTGSSATVSARSCTRTRRSRTSAMPDAVRVWCRACALPLSRWYASTSTR